MPLMKTSNPALGENTFRNVSGGGYGGITDFAGRMTLNGTVNKTGILLVCAIATAAWTWHSFLQTRDIADVAPMMLGGAIGGFIFALVTIFKKEWSPVTAPIYALLEGLLLLAYRSGMIQVTQKFRLGIIAATGGIAVFYLLEMMLSFFGIRFAAINGSGVIGIGFSVFVVAIAALNLVLDFDFIERGVQAGAPKYMEWYGAFGIMVTLVWLYLEILRLLSKVRSRN
jgi:uncharacterized YccA/Bax inhibitor family protein